MSQIEANHLRLLPTPKHLRIDKVLDIRNGFLINAVRSNGQAISWDIPATGISTRLKTAVRRMKGKEIPEASVSIWDRIEEASRHTIATQRNGSNGEHVIWLTLSVHDMLNILSGNDGNRPAFGTYIDNLSLSIEKGDWTLTGQGIALDARLEDGSRQIIDGQNRLFAHISLMRPMETSIALGLTPEAKKWMDKGRGRTTPDTYIMTADHNESLPSPTSMIPWLNRIWTYAGNFTTLKSSLGVDFVVDMRDHYRSSLEWLKSVANDDNKHIFMHTTIASALCIAYRRYPGEFTHFAREVALLTKPIGTTLDPEQQDFVDNITPGRKECVLVLHEYFELIRGYRKQHRNTSTFTNETADDTMFKLLKMLDAYVKHDVRAYSSLRTPSLIVKLAKKRETERNTEASTKARAVPVLADFRAAAMKPFLLDGEEHIVPKHLMMGYSRDSATRAIKGTGTDR